MDTGADNSLLPDESLFEVQGNGNRWLGTSSTAPNIHSHWLGAGSAEWAGYEVTGRMRMGNASGGVGVTFFSQFPNEAAYYRLRRYADTDFHLKPKGTSHTGGITNSGIVPVADTWYEFRVQVQDMGARTEVRANVWEFGTSEPAGWQIDAYDSSATRLVAGSFGVWGFGEGNKDFDDLAVRLLSPPLQVDNIPWTEKPTFEPPVNRQFSGMAPVAVSSAPTYRIPLIDDAVLIDDNERPCPVPPCIDIVPNLGGGTLGLRNGESALHVNANGGTSFPQWENWRVISLNNEAWTVFLDLEILSTVGSYPALVAKRRDSAIGYWQLNRIAGGADVGFAWSDGTHRTLTFPGGWPGAGRHQVILTRDDGTYVYYVDGQERGRATDPNPIPPSVSYHDLTLGVLQSDSAINRLEAHYYNVWFNARTAVSADDVVALWDNPWRINKQTNVAGCTVGEPCAIQLGASGGIPPYTWSITSGSLPDGLYLSASGNISGTPSAATESPLLFTVEVQDDAMTTATADLSITCTPQVEVPALGLYGHCLVGMALLAAGVARARTLLRFEKRTGALPHRRP